MNLETETRNTLIAAENDLLRLDPPLEFQQLKDVMLILTAACMTFVDLTAHATMEGA